MRIVYFRVVRDCLAAIVVYFFYAVERDTGASEDSKTHNKRISNCDFISFVKKPSSNQDVLVSSEASVPCIPADSSLISPPTSGSSDNREVLLEKVVVSRSSNDENIPSAAVEESNAQAVVNSGSQDDVDKIRLDQAAIKAQAAIRGYQVITSYICTSSLET